MQTSSKKLLYDIPNPNMIVDAGPVGALPACMHVTSHYLDVKIE